MHIEPGYINPIKVMAANITATGVLVAYAKALLMKPLEIVKTILAAIFFSLFIQSFHMNIGPSELHFVGAMAIYLTLGFAPALFGFAAGLLLQGILFEPMDLPHLAVNSLSLIVPLLGVHYSVGKKLFDKSVNKVLTWKKIIQLDAMYYAGVTLMVGFWLMIGEVETPFTSWLSFASSYIAIVAIEPIVTFAFVRLLKKHETSTIVEKYFSVKKLTLAN